MVRPNSHALEGGCTSAAFLTLMINLHMTMSVLSLTTSSSPVSLRAVSRAVAGAEGEREAATDPPTSGTPGDRDSPGSDEEGKRCSRKGRGVVPSIELDGGVRREPRGAMGERGGDSCGSGVSKPLTGWDDIENGCTQARTGHAPLCATLVLVACPRA